MKIRPAKKEDIEEIYRLGKKTKELKFSRKMNFHDKVELNEFIKHPKDNILIVAKDSNKLCGFLYAKIVSTTWCILDNLVVEEKCREHGVGHELLNEFYKILKKQKVNYIQILEDIHQTKTRKFWKANGFKEEKVFVWADKIIK